MTTADICFWIVIAGSSVFTLVLAAYGVASFVSDNSKEIESE